MTAEPRRDAPRSVFPGDFPDPGVLQAGGWYYAYATCAGSVHIQVARSRDLACWEWLGEALPALPAWQPGGRRLTWAPEVAHTPAGYVLYYTGRVAVTGKQAISLAIANAPTGPFVDRSRGPLICQARMGGSIDPFPFMDANGTRFLLWKSDGNSCGERAELWIQRMTDDGLALVGEPISLGIRNNPLSWEGRVVEAPCLVRHEDTYYLFYSANNWATRDYGIGCATARSVTGPYRRVAGNPLISSRGPMAGPGGQAVVLDPECGFFLLYHAWDAGCVGYRNGGRRSLWLDSLSLPVPLDDAGIASKVSLSDTVEVDRVLR